MSWILHRPPLLYLPCTLLQYYRLTLWMNCSKQLWNLSRTCKKNVVFPHKTDTFWNNLSVTWYNHQSRVRKTNRREKRDNKNKKSHGLFCLMLCLGNKMSSWPDYLFWMKSVRMKPLLVRFVIISSLNISIPAILMIFVHFLTKYINQLFWWYFFHFLTK